MVYCIFWDRIEATHRISGLVKLRHEIQKLLEAAMIDRSGAAAMSIDKLVALMPEFRHVPFTQKIFHHPALSAPNPPRVKE